MVIAPATPALSQVPRQWFDASAFQAGHDIRAVVASSLECEWTWIAVGAPDLAVSA